MPLGRPLTTGITIIVVALLIAGLLINRVTDTVRLRHLPLLIAFAIASAASSWLSPYAETSMRRGASGFLLMLVFPAAQIMASNARAMTCVRRAALGAIVLCAIDIAWQFAFGRSLLLGIPEPIDHSRYTGSLANANEVGFVALLLPISLIDSTRARERWIRMGAILCACFSLLLASSRASLAGMFVGANLRSWLGTRRFLKWSVLIAVAIGAFAWLADLGSFRARLEQSLRPQQEMRLQTWCIAWSAFLEQPLIGQGPAVFFEVNEASRTAPHAQGWETPPGGMPWVHNVPLELLTERGVIGAAVFVALACMIVRDLRRGLQTARTRAWSRALAASLATFAAMSLLDLSLLKDWCSVCLWLTCGFAASSAREDSEESQGATRDSMTQP